MHKHLNLWNLSLDIQLNFMKYYPGKVMGDPTLRSELLNRLGAGS
jgi:hypothetical protein